MRLFLGQLHISTVEIDAESFFGNPQHTGDILRRLS